MVSLRVGNMNSWLCGQYVLCRQPVSFWIWEFYGSINVLIPCFVEKDINAHQWGRVAYKPTNYEHRLLGKSEITDWSQAQRRYVELASFTMILKNYFLKMGWETQSFNWHWIPKCSTDLPSPFPSWRQSWWRLFGLSHILWWKTEQHLPHSCCPNHTMTHPRKL